jgi:hypothetical protein
MFDVEALSEVLDTAGRFCVSPLDIKGCRADLDDEDQLWFHHPDWYGVACKFGTTRKGRWMKVWLWLEEDKRVHVLATSDTFMREFATQAIPPGPPPIGP